MKCKECHEGKHLPYGGSVHKKCETKWNAKHIPKGQKRNLSKCPHCKKKFYYHQLAALHAEEKKHWGDYNP